MTHYNSMNLSREFKYYKLRLLVGGEGYGGFMVEASNLRWWWEGSD
jgi:hypothetical protein